MDIKEKIRKYALQNAVKFNGKANPGAVIGKLLAEDPNLKSKIKDLSRDIQDIIKEISNLSVKEQEAELKRSAPELLEKKKVEKKHELPELKNAKKGKVVMRFAPSPSGPMHLGHAFAISLSSEYCRKYQGQLILRIEDTNPENIYEPAYKLLAEDGKWITKNNISKVMIQSDRLGYYYDYAEKLVNMGKAYVCTCNTDEFRTLIFKKQACPCRNLKKKEQELRFAKMFAEYKPGEAVLRIKTDIEHPNPAMRDFPLMRINEHEHPRTGTKQRVWPLMNLAVFVDDVESGMTHIIRAKDHMDNAKRQEYLYKYFKKPIPETLFVGRINFIDLRISCSKTKVLIEEGKYTGWDDIRIPFLLALKRRGYQPEAFIKHSLDIGVSQNDKTVSKEEFFKALNHFNKEIIEEKANRYFFIEDPQQIVIEKAPEQEVELDIHPDYPKKGKRKFKTKNKFYIAKEDLKNIKEGELIRLMDCLNFTKKGNKFVFDSLEYEKYKEHGKLIIHWLPLEDNLVNVELLMPDNTFKKGVAEKSVKRLKPGDLCQFERIGFVRLDQKEKDKLIFWYGHR
ncbi:glutamate--tRNA ligase [Candidatus Woesearchaeota archaeon]|nr:glutamate--tRNA ligase [Candidatus Woesearchaeota archaeon]